MKRDGFNVQPFPPTAPAVWVAARWDTSDPKRHVRRVYLNTRVRSSAAGPLVNQPGELFRLITRDGCGAGGYTVRLPDGTPENAYSYVYQAVEHCIKRATDKWSWKP